MSVALEESDHLKNPFKVSSNIVFGSPEGSKCPVDKSKIELTLSIGSPSNALEKYHNLTVTDVEKCTKEIVKFSPVSLTADCKQTQFDDILAITDFKLNMAFDRVSYIRIVEKYLIMYFLF